MEQQNGRSGIRWVLNGLALSLAMCLCGCFENLFEETVDPPNWETSLASAVDRAQTGSKMILLYFSGSDWCASCQRLDAGALSQKEFALYARDIVVPAKIDFPRETAQSPEAAEANRELAKRFGVTKHPTLIVLDSNGEALGRTEFVDGSAVELVAELASLASGQPAKSAAQGLQLNGISGTPGHRLAVINNATVAEGESTSIRRSGEKVEIHCLSIDEERVLVRVDGQIEPAELRLRGRL